MYTGPTPKLIAELGTIGLMRITESFLNSFKDDEALVVGNTSYKRSQLQWALRHGTPLGERLMEMAKNDNLLVEEFIREGKVKKRTDYVVELPDFEF